MRQLLDFTVLEVDVTILFMFVPNSYRDVLITGMPEQDHDAIIWRAIRREFVISYNTYCKIRRARAAGNSVENTTPQRH